MLRLRNRHKPPINGFQYFQPETGRDFKEWSFTTICDAIQADRIANPRFNLTTDRASIEQEVDYVNALRMSKVSGGGEYISDPSLPTAQPSPKAMAPQFLQRVGQVAAGAVALVDWIKDKAEAVTPEKAYSRAAICASCPLNDKNGDLLSYFTKPVSDAIRSTLAWKNDLKLETPYDSQLGICTACACPLRLKLWMPLDRILDKMDSGTKSDLDPNCWITKPNG